MIHCPFLLNNYYSAIVDAESVVGLVGLEENAVKH